MGEVTITREGLENAFSPAQWNKHATYSRILSFIPVSSITRSVKFCDGRRSTDQTSCLVLWLFKSVRDKHDLTIGTFMCVVSRPVTILHRLLWFAVTGGKEKQSSRIHQN
jgi:hypothetical protein